MGTDTGAEYGLGEEGGYFVKSGVRGSVVGIGGG